MPSSASSRLNLPNLTLPLVRQSRRCSSIGGSMRVAQQRRWSGTGAAPSPPNSGRPAMETTHRLIFREEALLRHQHGQERTDVRPIAYTPRTIRLLWGILALIVIIGALCGFARAPVSVAGQAVVVPGAGASTENPSVLVVLPTAAFDLITPGDA